MINLIITNYFRVKSTYTAGLLYIFTVITIKISIITFMRALVPCPSHAKFSLALGITFIAWGIGSVFAAAFQCKLPSPWLLEGNACFDIVSASIIFLERMASDE